ncbi:serine/threonine-protein kinase [Polyangium jinanense]|uniref:Serine/threonine protein kinase n=1 Tax=Polyangium jinanense TaxID=2829994 RepID=A0A9X3X8Z8_9BACT|nr:serine/threonine-protein kinase [Polyangium jinanense]MDC3960048.1 serine/threonine protein kinase [Polyangium jinanense]MDC3986184.1 serine/threonine protein kinase [Polyangium jinanense]
MGDDRNEQGERAPGMRPDDALPDLDPEPRSIAPPSTIPLSPGTVVADKFALQRVIASGGMGTVFEAWDTLIERKVALKLMHPHYATDPSMVARFRREAQAAARVQHPNIVNVLEVGRRRDGAFYLVQELLVGQTLREHLDARGPLEPDEALAILVPVMSGIAAAHASGIIHRDLKPENVILSRSPSGEIIPKIIDFGLAKLHEPGKQSLTRLGMLLGTPQYMAPEQVLAEKVDTRADVWAMGVVTFEMLSGVQPFGAEGLARLLAKIVSSEPPPSLDFVAPKAAWPFAPVVARALARDLKERFATILDFRDALCEAHGGARLLVGHAAPHAGQLAVPGLVDVVPIEDPVLDAPVHDLAEGFAAHHADDGGGYVRVNRPPPPMPPRPAATPQRPRVPVLTPLPASRTEWGGPESRSQTDEDPVKLAEEALDVNALGDAIRWAEIALEVPGESEDVRGKAWLVLAIAHRWLGHYSEAARAAQEAMARMARGSNGWHAAFGHLVIAYGYLGRKDRLLARVDELVQLEEEEGVTTEAHLVSACRLAIFVIRAGVPPLGRKLARDAHSRVARAGAVGPFLRAWLAAARAEIAIFEGDPAAYLRRVEAAVDGFTEASDVRNACVQRTNVGLAYMHLGAYDRACFGLRRAVAVAEPMQLDFVPFAQGALGYCLAHLGRDAEGLPIIEAALETSRQRKDRRREAGLLVHAARIRAMQGDHVGAVTLARTAAEEAEDIPAQRAYALAVLASSLLAEGHTVAALAPASEAASHLDRIGGIEDGEALTRLVQALALHGTGQEADAKRRLGEARRRLLEKADKIGDRRFRRSFLEQVPDHRRLIETAAQWLGPA